MSTIPTQPIDTRAAPALPELRTRRQGYLGRALFHASSPKPGMADVFLLLMPGVLGVLALLGYAFWLWNSTYQRFGPTAALAWAAPWYGLGIIAMLVFLAICLYRLALASRYITIYEGGLQARLALFKQLTLTWDDISGLAAGSIQTQVFGLVLKTRPVARLFRKNGRSIDLPGAWAHLPEAVPILKTRLYPQLWPVLSAEFQSGSGARFGPLSLNAQALRWGNRSIPWEQVARLHVQSGYLLVECIGERRLRVPVVKIPNLELLLQLVDWGVNAPPTSKSGEMIPT